MLLHVPFPLEPSDSWVLVASVVGACAGSFAGAVSLRFARGACIVLPRSNCLRCRRTLPPWALVPLASYWLLGGRCHACGARIPLRYPLLEAGLAVAFGVAMHVHGPTWAFARVAILCGALALAAMIDLDTRRIPDALTLTTATAGVALASLAGDLSASLGAAAVAAAAMMIMRLLGQWVYARPGAGLGDVKFALALGLLVGWPVLWMLYFAILLGGLAGAVGILSRRLQPGSTLPFAPCLAGGAAAAWLLAPDVLLPPLP